MAFLLDTNVLSELRRSSKCEPQVWAWAQSVGDRSSYISVLSLGEIRKGIEVLRRRSPEQVSAFESWIEKLTAAYEDCILPITEEVAEHWGRLDAMRNLPVIDGLLAATALHYRLTIVTRNIHDFPDDMQLLNPWDFSS